MLACLITDRNRLIACFRSQTMSESWWQRWSGLIYIFAASMCRFCHFDFIRQRQICESIRFDSMCSWSTNAAVISDLWSPSTSAVELACRGSCSSFGVRIDRTQSETIRPDTFQRRHARIRPFHWPKKPVSTVHAVNRTQKHHTTAWKHKPRNHSHTDWRYISFRWLARAKKKRPSWIPSLVNRCAPKSDRRSASSSPSRHVCKKTNQIKPKMNELERTWANLNRIKVCSRKYWHSFESRFSFTNRFAGSVRLVHSISTNQTRPILGQMCAIASCTRLI